VSQTFTFDDLKRILVDRVGMKEADVVDDRGMSLEDMGLDSLAFVEVQLALEQEYGFTIPDEDAHRIAHVGEAIDYTNRRLAEQE
jgi:acyl carrier protein